MKAYRLFFPLLIGVMVFGSVAEAPTRYATIAGNAARGFSGDGGLCIYAQFAGPAGLATDTAGNLYIADYANDRIRKITYATGVVATIAGSDTTNAFSGDGGPATDAELTYPTAVTPDALGNIYFADQSNGRIRMMHQQGLLLQWPAMGP